MTKYIVMAIAPSVCAIAAGYLALHGIDAWGWFLFVAFWLAPSRAT